MFTHCLIFCGIITVNGIFQQVPLQLSTGLHLQQLQLEHTTLKTSQQSSVYPNSVEDEGSYYKLHKDTYYPHGSREQHKGLSWTSRLSKKALLFATLQRASWPLASLSNTGTTRSDHVIWGWLYIFSPPHNKWMKHTLNQMLQQHILRLPLLCTFLFFCVNLNIADNFMIYVNMTPHVYPPADCIFI